MVAAPREVERPGPIYEATEDCRQTFTACLLVEKLMKKQWAENRLADLNLWASGIGASVQTKASLDTRLQMMPHVREVNLALLSHITTTLRKCKTLAQARHSNNLDSAKGTISSTSPWSDQFSNETVGQADKEETLASLVNEVDVSLNELVRIAAAIRRAGTKSRLRRADAGFEPGAHKELQAHLVTVIATRASGCAKELDDIQIRLIMANLKRRNRFIYAQTHSKALAVHGFPSAQIRLMSNAAMDWQWMTTVSNFALGTSSFALATGISVFQKMNEIFQRATARTLLEATKPEPRTHGSSTATGTNASAMSTYTPMKLTDTMWQGAATQMSNTIRKIEYPRPPVIASDTLVFKCPTCCQSLPVMFAESDRWKKHIAEDVSPYTCILARCHKPEVLFQSRDQWNEHLLQDHGSVDYWLCFACRLPLRFDDETAFENHIREAHRNAILPESIGAMLSSGKQTAPIDISTCPFCAFPRAEDGNVDKMALLDHIAEEVHAFSLRSLPWLSERLPLGGTQAPSSTGEELNERCSQWLRELDLVSQLPPEAPDQYHPPESPLTAKISYDDQAMRTSEGAILNLRLALERHSELIPPNELDDPGVADHFHNSSEYFCENAYFYEGTAGSLQSGMASEPDDSQRDSDGVTSDDGSVLEMRNKEQRALYLASQHGHLENQTFNLQYLQLQENQQVENRQFTAVPNVSKTKHDTAKNALSNLNGHAEMVKLLLDQGADVNAQGGDYGNTLQAASAEGHVEIVKLLLDTGKVDVDAKDNEYGRTPLGWAAEGGHEAVVKLLLDTDKVDVESGDSDDRTPLSWAAGNGHEAVVKRLLDTGRVDVESKDKGGRTPLLWAAGNGYEAVVKLLLDTGKADVELEDA
ncbi:hypothetical protein LTR56_013036 [Elasticomyces elasticus]|nr:hypothetical protein LTR22_021971 [Elasticomyces elasticus]KAK3638564.1 hypothetical protein LTR56_013036 [Elasticomyces elasticus]KAK4928146.1 hypothetical protein LTR49_005084 [Elasticomyces elasticus]KAK5765898.1 hypothetical protein LTS12_003905 [Elasticomyces elasticus]